MPQLEVLLLDNEACESFIQNCCLHMQSRLFQEPILDDHEVRSCDEFFI
jgi:hypothetical protein